MKERFIQLWREVERDGVKGMLEWLETTDFYTAPCSTRYHLSHEGGLLEHSLNVYEVLNHTILCHGDMGIDQESQLIAALSHDFCKANYYTQEMRNVKENGAWVQKPYYTVKDQFPYGHGEKSALLVNRFIKLKVSEHMAIRWHMGGFTPGIQDYSISSAMSEAYKTYPLALLLHMADMEASYLIESREDKHE